MYEAFLPLLKSVRRKSGGIPEKRDGSVSGTLQELGRVSGTLVMVSGVAVCMRAPVERSVEVAGGVVSTKAVAELRRQHIRRPCMFTK